MAAKTVYTSQHRSLIQKIRLLRLAAVLRRHRTDRRPLRRILGLVLQHHPNLSLMHFGCVPRQLAHAPILSRFGASEKAGAVHDAARAVHYMDIRYEGGMHGMTNRPEPDLIVDDPGLIQTTLAGVFAPLGYMGLKSVLLRWHAADPPDASEQLRNDVVFSYHGNRNPFIDHPEWAECLYSCTCLSAPPAESFGNGFED